MIILNYIKVDRWLSEFSLESSDNSLRINTELFIKSKLKSRGNLGLNIIHNEVCSNEISKYNNISITGGK